MPSKKTPSPKRSKVTTQKKKPRGVATRRAPMLNSEALDTLAERLDMMLPEVMSRIAAVEHVMVEKGVCSHADLRRARQFIDEQESW
ncbi:MAG: hypothetical protein JSU59_08035 [Nitrospirota bacterium]|nr:MAG: hypothetical protein JSU59_08035 [Nitrospirota bacterium]